MKRVTLVPTIRGDEDLLYTERVAAECLRFGATVQMAEPDRKGAEKLPVAFVPEETAYRDSDVAIVLGGDGSILRAAKKAMPYDLPILGINLGRLGYMAELEKEELHLLKRLFTENFSVKERMVLRAGVISNGEERLIGNALNDVVVDRSGQAHCIDMKLCADGKTVRTIRADGLIFSTPTGSTAYSMAAGGSVLDPSLRCICATPICPISRYACPTVFSGDALLTVEHADDRADAWHVNMDGEKMTMLRAGEKLTVCRSGKTVRMISLKDESFFERLNSKISKYELKN